jgi:hypothetical protein
VLSTGYGYPGIDGSNRPNIAADIDCIFDIDTFTSIRFAGTTIRNNTNIAFTRNNINTTFMKFGTAPDITNLGVYSNYGVMNGSIFEVYDV